MQLTTHPVLLRALQHGAAVLSLALVAPAQTPPDQILLKEYRPRSIFKIPESRVERARYAVIDVHSHDYAPGDADVDRWVRTMGEVRLDKTIILSGSTGPKFDAALAKYGRHPNRFLERDEAAARESPHRIPGFPRTHPGRTN